MTQNTQSEIDAAEKIAADGTEQIDILGGISEHDGFTERSDESTETDYTPPTNMFKLSSRALRHQERCRTQDELMKLNKDQMEKNNVEEDSLLGIDDCVEFEPYVSSDISVESDKSDISNESVALIDVRTESTTAGLLLSLRSPPPEPTPPIRNPYKSYVID